MPNLNAPILFLQHPVAQNFIYLFHLLSFKFFKGRYHHLVYLVSYHIGWKEGVREGRRKKAANGQCPTTRLHKSGELHSHTLHLTHTREHRNVMSILLLGILQCGSSGEWHTGGIQCTCIELYQWQLTVKAARRKLTTSNDGLHAWI